MEIQHLRHFLAAAGSTSYAQAAKKCFTSRQNIAHSVKSLEGELGVTLFERQGNGMVLTESGRKASLLTEEIISRIDGLKTTFSTLSPDESSLSLAVSVNLFAGMPEGIDAVFSNYSGNLQFLELDCEQCYEQVCSGKVDAAIVMCMDRAFPKCNVARVGGSLAYALVNESADLANKSGCVASDLAKKKLLLMSEPTFQYEPLFRQLDQLGYDRSNVSVLPSTSSMIRLVRTRGEDYLAIPSRKFAATPPGGTAAVPIVDPRMNWGFYLLYRSNEPDGGKVIKFLAEIRRAFAESDIAASRGAGRERAKII